MLSSNEAPVTTVARTVMIVPRMTATGAVEKMAMTPERVAKNETVVLMRLRISAWVRLSGSAEVSERRREEQVRPVSLRRKIWACGVHSELKIVPERLSSLYPVLRSEHVSVARHRHGSCQSDVHRLARSASRELTCDAEPEFSEDTPPVLGGGG